MRLFEAVEMDVKEKARSGLEFVEALADEHSVSAEINVLFALQNFGCEAANFGIDHGLAAADGNDGSAAIIERGEALFDSQHFVDGGFVFADAAAARARKIARVQRLEHHHQRKFFFPADFFPCEIAC